MMDSSDLTLEESEEMMDLNKSFYIDEELDLDLKQVSEPVFEDAQLDLKTLTLEEESSTGLVRPQFGHESLLSDVLDNQYQKKYYKRCKSCGKLKNMFSFRIHEKRCTRNVMDFKNRQVTSDIFNCLSCEKTFTKKTGLVLHMKTTKVCGKPQKRSCNHGGVNRSRHSFKELSIFHKNRENGQHFSRQL